MRFNHGIFQAGQLTRGVALLLGACGGVFALQVILPTAMENEFVRLFGLSVDGIKQGWWWQVMTYGLLHGNLLHILLNMLGLYFLGPELERHMGFPAFLVMFGCCVVLGGLGWLAMMYPTEGVCVGASGGIFGLIGAFAGFFPRRQITLLVFFVLPVTMPAWLMGALFGLVQLAYLFDPGPSGIAYAAHLAGGIAGYVFARLAMRPRTAMRYDVQRRSMFAADSPSSEEIDRILDKISREGIHTLTPRERDQLQRAGKRSRGW
ncbi:MAG TPA: rhomboid family intramembrane serine protease [Kiritimatiellia bacterium]|nr:rhomboid family intramembrane serine protease [Kiritimatiellia bacterium]HMP34235.1 rhomboid family intramembrane serine protease [Kiritimatiellia bacterium]